MSARLTRRVPMLSVSEDAAAGLPVTPLRVTIYGMTEFELRDPDGYWLWFGESTSDAPMVTE